MCSPIFFGGRLRFILLTLAFFGASVITAIAESPKWVELGVLDCTIGPSIGLVSGSRQHARCSYKAAGMAGTKNYIGRLERVAKVEGLPSGGKLIWIVVARAVSSKKELSGRYVVPSEKAQFDEGDPHIVCRATEEVICLRPASQEAKRKPNFAFIIAAFRLETSPARPRRH